MQEKINSWGLNHTSLTMPVLYLVATLEGRLYFMTQVLQTSCKCTLQQEHAQAVQLSVVLCTSLHQIFPNQHYLPPFPGCKWTLRVGGHSPLGACARLVWSLPWQGAWPASCLLRALGQRHGPWEQMGNATPCFLIQPTQQQGATPARELSAPWLSRGQPPPDFG